MGLLGHGLASTQNEDLSIDTLNISPEIISPTGKSKVRDHIQAIEQNITHTETNLTSTKKNIGVIESEIKELEGLAVEHSNLKKRYLEFLSTADKETAKNEKALSDIAVYERKVEPLAQRTQNPTRLAELETAKNEKLQREEWRKETEQRKLKIKELLAGVEKNLRSIELRKAPLKEQLQAWNNRLNEYQSMLTKLNQKKQDAERFLASPNKSVSQP